MRKDQVKRIKNVVAEIETARRRGSKTELARSIAVLNNLKRTSSREEVKAGYDAHVKQLNPADLRRYVQEYGIDQ